MLGWIEKVVPQPPAASPIHVVVEKAAQAEQATTSAPEARARLARQLPEGQSSHLAEGRRQEETNELHNHQQTPTSPGRAVVSWLSQGLGKVIPQPASQSTPVKLEAVAKSFEASMDIPDVTEVQSINYDDDDGLEVTILDGEEEDEEDDYGELQSSSDNNAPDKIGGKKVFTWLLEGFGKMMPQPENMRKAEEEGTEERTSKQGSCKENNRGTPGTGNCPASSPSASGPKHRSSTGSQSNLSVSLFPRSLGGDGISVLEWIVQGLEKAMPRPATKTNQDGQPGISYATQVMNERDVRLFQKDNGSCREGIWSSKEQRSLNASETNGP